MPDAKTFLDTNVLLDLLSSDTAKANRAEQLVAEGGIISVQVLNEFVGVASRKLAMSWDEIREVLGAIRVACKIEPVTLGTHDRAVEIAQRYGLSIYDAAIVAAALIAECTILQTEDLQAGQVIETLTVHNPFAPSGRYGSYE